MTVLILILTIGLAAANGANDVSKGVATLAGAGVTRYRTAILWGTVTTLLGALVSVVAAGATAKLFAKGIVSIQPDTGFTAAVLVGTLAWIALATVARLPVSTTHALVGSLLGAGLMLASDAVLWNGVVKKVVTPLLLSVVVAYLISVLLTLIAQGLARLRVGSPRRPASAPVSPAPAPPAGDGGVATAVETRAGSDPQPADVVDRVENAVHWLTSGAASAARGMNDTPKIAAIGAFALIPAGLTAQQVGLIVALAMAVGSLAGIRVARPLGERVVRLSHGDGMRANLTTAALVGAGATLGLPMTTTQVSASSIAGTAGLQLNRINGRTVRDFAIAWTITPVFGAVVAAVVYTVIR